MWRGEEKKKWKNKEGRKRKGNKIWFLWQKYIKLCKNYCENKKIIKLL